MNYTLPSGREVTSEVLLKIEPEYMAALPIACKVCPAALWQLTGKVESPQPQCFCRVKHVYTWPAPPDKEILDCDLIYIAEAKEEAQQEQREQKLNEKDEREQRKSQEKAEMEQRQRDREARRKQREDREDKIREERREDQQIRQQAKELESSQKTERARLRAQNRKTKKTNTTEDTNTQAQPVIPTIPGAGSHSDLPAFQDWADQIPPSESGEDLDRED